MGFNRLAATAATWSRQQAELAGRPDGSIPVDSQNDHTQPLLANDEHVTQIHGHRYGAVDVGGSSSDNVRGRRTSPELHRRESILNRVPEEPSADDDGAQEIR